MKWLAGCCNDLQDVIAYCIKTTHQCVQVSDKRVRVSANLYRPPPYSARCTVTEKWNFAAVFRRINRELRDFFWLHRNQRVLLYRFHTKPCMCGNFLKIHREAYIKIFLVVFLDEVIFKAKLENLLRAWETFKLNVRTFLQGYSKKLAAEKRKKLADLEKRLDRVKRLLLMNPNQPFLIKEVDKITAQLKVIEKERVSAAIHKSHYRDICMDKCSLTTAKSYRKNRQKPGNC